MEIRKSAVAGTVESSDAQITVEPFSDGLEVSIESSVMNQYGRQIKRCTLDTLHELSVTAGRIKVVDKGALECTLKARIECAVYRSNDASEKNIPWGGAVR
jgi:citrate lyase subunit gamma (acyl carrier protein)